MLTSTMKHNSIFENRQLNEDLRSTTILKELETSYFGDAKRFRPAALKDIMTVPFFDIELYIKTSVSNKPKYVLYYKGKDILKNNKKEDLVRRNIHRLFMPKNGGYRYVQYIEANLRDIILDEMEESEVKTRIAYDVGINMAKDIFSNGKLEPLAIERTKDWIFTMIEFMLENDDVFSNMVELMQNDESIYKHSVNVTVIGLLFAKYTGLNMNLMNKLGIGLLLHDIGLVKPENGNISQEYVKKEYDKESGILQHPLIGASKLAKTRKFAPETLEAIREHHENVDGTGYPYNLKGEEISQLSKYVRIIDEYSLLIIREKEKKTETPRFFALNKMVNQLRNKLDKNLLTDFVNFLGAGNEESNNRFGRRYLSSKYNRSIGRTMVN
ncbi:MAG: HD-GYP domain-containing protein [Candidatus Anammoxibacter sp.]